MNEEKHKYYPDFILEDGTYVEVKGYYTEETKVKLAAFPHKIIIIDKQKIKMYLDYAISKYGKNFVDLYEK